MTARGFPTSTSTLTTASSGDLVGRAQRGDELAFAALFEAHKRSVYSLTLRMTGHAAEAEALTQEAFLQVFRKIAACRAQSPFSTWLHRLTINEVLTHLRRKRLQEGSSSEAPASTVTAG